MKKITFLILAVSILTLSGCAVQKIDDAITNYRQVSHQISLGDSKAKVVSILDEAQKDVPIKWRKSSETYIKDDVEVEIYYSRTRRQADGLVTDDEFTPYVFNNSKLVAIGWTSIGGTKSQGQARSITNVHQSTSVIVR
ncbi:MAG: DUF3192 domain-containing protein [bacterium]|nr:DUF3192 domain-containing protein [Candidatus Thioglobus pontius]